MSANIFDASARRCPYCRCTAFYGTSCGAETLTCADCGRVVRRDELTRPDWKGEGREPDNDDPMSSLEFLY